MVTVHGRLHAQDYIYKSITVKTNVINLFNIGVEFPLYKRFTLDMSNRYYPGLGSYIPVMTGRRINLRYHIPLEAYGRNIPSLFLSAGFNWYSSYIEYFPTERNEMAVESYSVRKASFGIGIKSRIFSIWVAYEPLLQTYENYHKLYPYIYASGTPIQQSTLPDGRPFAAGLAITLMNIKLKADMAASYLPTIPSVPGTR